jgi:hypothetical protein
LPLRLAEELWMKLAVIIRERKGRKEPGDPDLSKVQV